jgi:hypothetical protein
MPILETMLGVDMKFNIEIPEKAIAKDCSSAATQVIREYITEPSIYNNKTRKYEINLTHPIVIAAMKVMDTVVLDKAKIEKAVDKALRGMLTSYSFEDTVNKSLKKRVDKALETAVANLTQEDIDKAAEKLVRKRLLKGCST